MSQFDVYDNENEEYVNPDRFVLRGDGELFEIYTSRTGRMASRECGDRFQIEFCEESD